MSDMPDSRRTPPTSDHAQHDPLLIAQAAAGDPLAADQQRQAELLLASCTECAGLAADLRVIATAVAWEPLPPRRRDFRIDPERAEQLHGSALQRILRRFSLPETRALQPVAAGVLSLGLLFMVAGAVWPEGAPVQAPLQPEQSPALLMQLEAPAADVSAGTPPAGLELQAQPEAMEMNGEAMDAAAQPDAAGDASEASLAPADVAGSVERAVDTIASDDAAAPAAGAAPAGTAAPLERAKAAPAPGASAVPAGVAEAFEAPTASGVENVTAATAAETEGRDGTIEWILLVTGAVLALGGALALLLAWLARRSADPLLR
jgi:hypothetical protein